MGISTKLKKINWLRMILVLFCVLVFAFLVAPIFIVIPLSFTSASHLQFPPPGYSLRWYEEFFTSPVWLSAAWLSIRTAIFATILTTSLGTMASFALIRGRFPGKDLVNSFLTAPMIVPLIIIAISIYAFFAQFKLIGTLQGLVLAHTILALPFVMSNVCTSLRYLDPALEHAASSLGANKFNAIIHVILPIIKPGVISGALFAFIISFDEIVVAYFITGRYHTLPTRMFDNIKIEIEPTIAAVSTLLILLSFIILLKAPITASWEQKDD